MKRVMQYLFPLLLLLLSCSCSQQARIERALSLAEDVVERRADSALMHLGGIADIVERGDDASRALYGLLLTEAKYRQDEDRPDSLLPVIRSSEELFGGAGDRLHQERSMYYHAMMLYQLDDHGQATIKLKEGEYLSEQLRDSVFLSKYYESLCMVNYNSKNFQEMLQYAKKFMSISIMEGDASNIVRGYDHVSGAFLRLGMPDSSFCYLGQVERFLSRCDSSTRAIALNNLGDAFYRSGHYDIARKYLLQALRLRPLPVIFKTLGDVYYRENDTVQALSCWKEAMKTPNATLHVSVMESFFNYYIVTNNAKCASDMHKRIVELKDSISSASEMSKLAEIQKKYDYQIVVNRYYRLFSVIIIVASAIVLLAVTFSHYYRRKVRHFESVIEQNESLITAYLRRIDEITLAANSYRQQKKQSDTLVEEYRHKADIFKEMADSYDAEIGRLKKKITEVKQNSVERLALGMKMYEMVMNQKRLPQDHKDNEPCFVEYFVTLHADVYAKWERKYSKLSLRLLTYLILEQMAFSDEEIACCLGVNKSSLRTIRARLRERQQG